jgi:hypothetical protein
MWVRKIDGKYQTRMKTPEVHGIAINLQKIGIKTNKKTRKLVN